MSCFQTNSAWQAIVILVSSGPYKPIMCCDRPRGIWLRCKSCILTSNTADLFLCIGTVPAFVLGTLACYLDHVATCIDRQKEKGALLFSLQQFKLALLYGQQPNSHQAKLYANFSKCKTPLPPSFASHVKSKRVRIQNANQIQISWLRFDMARAD